MSVIKDGKKLLLVNVGYNLKRKYFKRLKELRYYIICLNKERISWAEKYVDEWILCDTYNHDLSIRTVKEYLKSNEIRLDGIMTYWEDDVLLCSKLTDELGYIGIPHEVAVKARNKFLLREFCEENGLPAPKHLLIKSRDDLDTIKTELTFPVVIKPAYGSYSALVVKVETPDDLESEYEYVKANVSVDVESSLNDGLELFAEEYVDGDEVDIDLIIQNGKTKFVVVSDNFEKTRGKFFLDVGQLTPSVLGKWQQQELIDMAEVVLEKMGIMNGCIHFEAKYSSKGPMPLEINLRMGGGYVYFYIRSAWGVDLVELGAKVATGEYIQPIKNPSHKKFVIGKDISTEASGILTELNYPEKLKSLPYVEDFIFYTQVGDASLVPPEGYDSIGWVTVSGDSFPDVNDNLRKVLAEIQFSVAKFDSDSVAGGYAQRGTVLSKVLANRKLIRKSGTAYYIRKSRTKELSILLLSNLENRKTDIRWKDIKKMIEMLKNNGYKVSLDNSLTPLSLVRGAGLDRYDLALPAFVYPDIPNYIDYIKALELSDIPYAGNSSFTSELLSDVIRLRKILSFHELPFNNWDYLYEKDDPIRDDIEFPLVVKSARVSNVKQKDEIAFDNYADYSKNRVSKLADMEYPLLLEERMDLSKVYFLEMIGADLDSVRVWKESSNNTKMMSKKVKDLAIELAFDVFNITDAKGYLSVQFLLDSSGSLYVGDVSTVPTYSRYSDTEISSLFGELVKASVQKST